VQVRINFCLVVHSFDKSRKLGATEHGEICRFGQDASHTVAKGQFFHCVIRWLVRKESKISGRDYKKIERSARMHIICLCFLQSARILRYHHEHPRFHTQSSEMAISALCLTFLMFIINRTRAVIEDRCLHVIPNHVLIDVGCDHSADSKRCRTCHDIYHFVLLVKDLVTTAC
jgi:hypothetical protein